MEWIENFFLVPEGTTLLALFLIVIKKIVALIGTIVILWGACVAIYQFIGHRQNTPKLMDAIDLIRLKFGRTIILGLEFIVAADVIATTSAPDYYSVGILASLVGIRTLLTYFMNRELMGLSKK
ncbi:MAG: hypothetical protein K1000chlam3_01434 [Chlamydiae bacterium]|nr:hypothetical protein [Chlamydiota bacterium]